MTEAIKALGKRRIISLAIVFLLTTACNTMFNPGNVIRRNSYTEFLAATNDFAAGGALYKEAGTKLQSKCQSGAINADDCLAITDDERAVRIEARKVAAFARAWAAAGGRRKDKPGGYDDAVEKLKLARQKVIVAELLSEVTP